MKKVFILHLLPLEYYPPVTNLIKVLEQDNGMDVQVFSTYNNKKRTIFKSSNIKIFRCDYPAYKANSILKLWSHIVMAVYPLFCLWKFRADSILYFEPHSALPAYLYKRFIRPRVNLFIHFHEYYSQQEFSNPGMSWVRVFHELEKSFLFRKAIWISQTNQQRLRFFEKDNPFVDRKVLRTLANYPPKDWINHRQKVSEGNQLSLLYIGALSFENTYIKPLVNFVNANSKRISLTIYSYNCSQEVEKFLDSQNPDIIQFYKDGIAYEEIPKIAKNHQIGLILYTGHNLNYKYNAPNKLFEYLACGLDVWVSKEILGCQPFLKEDRRPFVISVDYTDLKLESLEKIIFLEEAATVKIDYFCENELIPLIKSLKINEC